MAALPLLDQGLLDPRIQRQGSVDEEGEIQFEGHSGEQLWFPGQEMSPMMHPIITSIVDIIIDHQYCFHSKSIVDIIILTLTIMHNSDEFVNASNDYFKRLNGVNLLLLK